MEAFIGEYDAWVEDAKDRLGTMFVAADYPSKEELRVKFDIQTIPGIINDPEDLRVGVQKEQIEELKVSIRGELESNINTANANILDRIRKTVGHLFTKLADPEAKFKGAVIENVQELIDLIPKLNFTGDVKIIEIGEEMKKLIVDPETLRKNPELRETVATTASNLLSKYGL